jgi:DNA adenine methylase
VGRWKTQLIKDIERTLPTKITKEKFTYIEPFVGSGAVLFGCLTTSQNLKKL